MQTIYQPKGQAREFGEWAANPYKGCGHACAYCYVPRNPYLGLTRAEFDAGAELRPGFIEAFEAKAALMEKRGVAVNIFFTFTSDMYNPFCNEPTRRILEIAKRHGHTFTILTKGGSRALRDLDLYDQWDHFASTLTSLDEAFSRKWERGAALPADRISTLRKFHEAGIFTWASLEPTIDTESSLAIVKATHEFVDFFKIGRVNYLPMTKTTDWKAYTLDMLELITRLGVRAYFKKDLQPYLPADYVSEPLRP